MLSRVELEPCVYNEPMSNEGDFCIAVNGYMEPTMDVNAMGVPLIDFD